MDNTSTNVASMYKKYPYPFPSSETKNVNELLNLFKFFSLENNFDFNNKNILDAGSGTGHRIINVAKYYNKSNFLGIDKDYLEKLHKVVNTWDIISNANSHINDIFDIELPNIFLDKIKIYNTDNYKIQIENINKTLNIINSQTDLSSLNTSIEEQSNKAIKWCNKYDIKINVKSNFLK